MLLKQKKKVKHLLLLLGDPFSCRNDCAETQTGSGWAGFGELLDSHCCVVAH